MGPTEGFVLLIFLNIFVSIVPCVIVYKVFSHILFYCVHYAF